VSDIKDDWRLTIAGTIWTLSVVWTSGIHEVGYSADLIQHIYDKL